MKYKFFFLNLFILGLLLAPRNIASSLNGPPEDGKKSQQVIGGLPEEIWQHHIVPHVKGKDSKVLREVSSYFADSGVISCKIDYELAFDNLTEGTIRILRPTKFIAGSFALDKIEKTISIFPNLVSLTISTNNNSVHVANIRKAQSLTELSLEISEWFTEEDILAISELKQLQTLKLGQKGGYTALIPTALKNLHLVAHPLEELEFHFLRDKLNDISNFHNLKKLKKLYLYGLYAITYEEFSGYTQTFQLIVTGLNTLKDCPHLEELGISGLIRIWRRSS